MNFYKYLSTPERSGNKIGLFRIISSIFGGLLTTFTSMFLLIFLIPSKVELAIFVPFLLGTLIWSANALWISVAPTKLNALLRFIVPSAICSIGTVIFY